MNAVVALCHFCEVHGPSVVMSTQPFRRQDESDDQVGDELDSTEKSDVTIEVSSPSGATSSSTSGPGEPQHYIPNEKVCDDENIADKLKEKAKCLACSSIPQDLTAFVSNDHAARTSYVSSQCAKDSKLFSMMRQACLRSLSCEMYPRQEGPIYFGDDKRGHVLSYFFFLKDNKARGLQVRYSIILVTLDKLYLLNSWSFLVRSIRQISKRLEAAAAKVFEAERRFSQPSRRNPPKYAPSLRITSVNNIRSLIELTNDQQIFQRCHIWFTWLLRAGGSQWKELLLEGPPIEDQVTLFEFYEGFDDEAIDVLQTIEPCADRATSAKESLNKEEEEKRTTKAPNSLPTPVSTPVPGEEGPELETLRQLYHLMGADRFEIVAYHIVMGNQVMVRCGSPALVRSILACLAKLIPQKCVICVPYSSTYLEEYRCKFLGLRSGVSIPSDALSRAVLVEVTSPPSAHCSIERLRPEQMEYRVTTNVRDYSEKPKFLKQVISLIQSDPSQVNESAFDRALLAFREDWIHKARLFFSFNRCERPNLPERDVEARYRGVVNALQMSKADECLVRFWTSGLSEHFKRQVSHGAAFRS